MLLFRLMGIGWDLSRFICEMTLVTGQLRLKTQVKYFTDWYTGRAKKLKLQFDGLRTYGCGLMARLWFRALAEEETEGWQGM